MFKKILIAAILLLAIPAHSEIINLKAENTIVLDDEVTSKNVTKAMAAIQKMNATESKEPINLVLNTPGGSVLAGIEFIRYAKTSRRPIQTITLYAASMGFQIVQGLPGKRLIAEGGILMSHRAALGGISGQIPGELDNRIAFFHDLTEDLDRHDAERAGMSLKEYQKLTHDEYYATPSKAIRDGFADKKVELSCDASLNGTHTKMLESPFGAIAAVFSDCPLISFPVSASFLQENATNKTLNVFDFIKRNDKL